MTSVTIFGSGNMGTAIDEVLSAGGATVDHIGSDDPPGPVNGDIVILAVYHAALQDILAKYADKFAGKTVVDITNPVNLETFDSLVVPQIAPPLRYLRQRCRPLMCSKRSIPPSRARSAHGRWARMRPQCWWRAMTPMRSLPLSRLSRQVVLKLSTPAG
jgi:hypothetical protein